MNNAKKMFISQPNTITIDLKYITAKQAKQLIKMFDSPDAYAENFSAIKAITRGLHKIIMDSNPVGNTPIMRMFRTVNDMQGTLMLDDVQEHERIINNSGLMPNLWDSFRSKKGGFHEQA